jgi:hypothetical protein
MTTHGYFNLSKDQTVHDHIVKMPNITCALAIDEFQIPTGKYLYPDTCPNLFFLRPATIGERLTDASLIDTKGFDHYYLSPKESGVPITKDCFSENILAKIYWIFMIHLNTRWGSTYIVTKSLDGKRECFVCIPIIITL